MNKVITLNLNGNAYQLEENGYEALRTYLETAARRLQGNPDKDEIIADIEAAIADKFRAVLGPHKTVVVTKEVTQILAEMGPVEDASTADEAQPASASNPGPGAPDPAPTRRLFKIREGAMLGGVCSGLAAYTRLDVTVIRVLFAILTVFTYGGGILAYLLLWFLLPPAETAAEKAAAHGEAPSTAQEYIRRAREGYYEGLKTLHDRRAHREWRRKFKHDMRGWSRDFRREVHAAAYQMGENWHRHWGQPPPSVHSWAALPFLGLARLILGLLWLCASISLLATGAFGGLALPAGMPLWVGLLLLFVAYRFAVWPFRVARRAYYFHLGYRVAPCAGVGDTLLLLAALAALVWFADRYVPAAHAAIQDLPPAVHHALDSIREWWGRR